jgi:hypothetical protein
VLPNKFVAGAIITKLPHSWRDFATSLKHKRKEFAFDDLIATLDVEEKARAKDTRGKKIAGSSSANSCAEGQSQVPFENNQANSSSKLASLTSGSSSARQANEPISKLTVLLELTQFHVFFFFA